MAKNTTTPNMQIIISIDAPGAMVRLGGITVWERLLRSIGELALGPIKLVVTKKLAPKMLPLEARIGAAEVASVDRVETGMTTEELLELLSAGEESVLIVPGDLVIDPRAIRALTDAGLNSALIDSALPESQAPLAEPTPTVSS